MNKGKNKKLKYKIFYENMADCGKIFCGMILSLMCWPQKKTTGRFSSTKSTINSY